MLVLDNSIMSTIENHLSMQKLVSLTKQRGLVYPGSEIYGGLSNSWDYGPVGVELKNNIKKAWWKYFVQSRQDIVGLDSAILMNPMVWKASGHLDGFADPLMDCRSCKHRHRADKLLEEAGYHCEGLPNEVLEQKIRDTGIKCPDCGADDFTPIRKFNLMFKTFIGADEDSSATVFLRPETAQGIFVNFSNIQTTTRKKIPFGIGQIGKSFRNEITPGNFIFRTREFEQMELEYFCHPSNSVETHAEFKHLCMDWLLSIGVRGENVRFRDHSKEELSHYSSATTDIEYQFPFGWGELWGIAHRGCFDLTQHQSHSKRDLSYLDPITNERYLPHVIEPALGVDRLFLAVLCDAYCEENVDGEVRTLLKLHRAVVPTQVAVLPLSKKLEPAAQKVLKAMSNEFVCDYDETGSIGKRYRRQDEIGTPLCITIDFDTETDNSVTVRDRDSMTQRRISINSLKEFLRGYYLDQTEFEKC